MKSRIPSIETVSYAGRPYLFVAVLDVFQPIYAMDVFIEFELCEFKLKDCCDFKYYLRYFIMSDNLLKKIEKINDFLFNFYNSYFWK